MSQYAVITDLNRCTGCLACTVACKAQNGAPIGNFWIRAMRVGPTAKADGCGDWPDVDMYFLPMQCQHCESPECVSVCPTGASVKTDNGTVQIDPDTCIGCQACVPACPYGVRYLNEELNVVEKCTLCKDITAEGGLPACVQQCGARARFYGDLDEGIDSFRAPADPSKFDGDKSYEAGLHNYVTYGEYCKAYGDDEVHYLPDEDGNGPMFPYIVRDRAWQEAEVSITETPSWAVANS
jgi:Fe-S-cluster-containing dehydrogenase component